MTYGEFKCESQKTEFGRYLMKLWMAGQIPLYPAIEFFEQNLQMKLL